MTDKVPTLLADAIAELERRCSRAEDEYPKLAAPDGTVAVPFTALRVVLNELAFEAAGLKS